jgi:D-aspartate ligase
MNQTSEKFTIVIATGLNGLGAIRSLHKAGIKVIAICSSKNDLPGLSRLPEKKIIVEKGLQWEDNLLAVLNKLEFKTPPAIIACSDIAADFIASNSNLLSPKYSFLVPNIETTKMLNDKKLEIEHMRRSNINIPKSATSIADLVTNSHLSNLKLPIIIKPRTFEDTKVINAKNVIISSKEELSVFYNNYKKDLNKLVAQEVIQGNDEFLWVCNATFDKNSKLIGAFTFQRLGTMPSHYGVTSIAISKDNKTIKSICEEIGKSLSYSGSAMFEFKLEQTSGKYIYIETNPRIGMCNYFDTSAGVNNVELNCLSAMGHPIEINSTQKDNLVFCNVLGDLIARLENSENIIDIFRLYSKFLFKGTSWAIFKLNDPYPFIVSFTKQSSELVRRTTRKLLNR